MNTSVRFPTTSSKVNQKNQDSKKQDFLSFIILSSYSRKEGEEGEGEMKDVNKAKKTLLLAVGFLD